MTRPILFRILCRRTFEFGITVFSCYALPHGRAVLQALLHPYHTPYFYPRREGWAKLERSEIPGILSLCRQFCSFHYLSGLPLPCDAPCFSEAIDCDNLDSLFEVCRLRSKKGCPAAHNRGRPLRSQHPSVFPRSYRVLSLGIAHFKEGRSSHVVTMSSGVAGSGQLQGRAPWQIPRVRLGCILPRRPHGEGLLDGFPLGVL